LSAIVIPALAGLAATHPGLQPFTVEQEPDESLPALLRGECDLAVVAAVGDGTTPLDLPVRTLPLTTDPLVTVVGPTEDAPTDLRDLADRPWVLDAPRSYLSDLVLRSCRSAGFEPRVVGRYRSFGLLLQQVEAGGAVTLLPRLAIDPRYRVRTECLQPPVPRTISLVVRAGAGPRPAVQAVIDALRAG
ncbi:MAG: LysR substrate-binding domain-containing protein, partial [Nakamurella sp.]